MLLLKRIGLFGGPGVFLLLMLASPSSFSTDEWNVVMIAALMLIWWVTEAVPIAVTALVPIVLFPATGVMSLKDATAPYGSDIVFLFLGGFLLALALEKWSLHKRVALQIVRMTGTRANRILLGFMLATAALSMWISNTATAVMMMPIALSVIGLVDEHESECDVKGSRNFKISMLLGIAYAANVGGIATLIGTPPNLVMAGYLREQFSIEVSFLSWLQVGLPFSLLLLFLTYGLLVHLLFPNGLGEFKEVRALIDRQLASLGRMGVVERRVLVVFLFTAGLWVFRTLINDQQNFLELTDTGIAVLSGIALFVVPSSWPKHEFLLSWEDTRRLPWGILLLFGGGLSLAAAFKETGLIDQMGQAVADSSIEGKFLLMLALTTVSLFLTEVMSNVALTTVFVPVVAAIAQGMGLPVYYFAVPVTMAASCAYMFPMSTPPNAIVFASGHLRIADMARAGLLLNLIAILLISVMMYFVIDLWAV